MERPRITIYDAATNFTETREMTDEEYEALVASGCTPTEQPTAKPEEETPTE